MDLGDTKNFIFLCQLGSSEKQMSNWIRYGQEGVGEMTVKKKEGGARYAFSYEASLTSLKKRGKEGGLGIRSQMTV